MKCQQTDCKNEATWRVIDRYKQGKMCFVNFHYLCDEHQVSRSTQHTVGHKLHCALIGATGPELLIPLDAILPPEEQEQYDYDPVAEEWIKV